MGPSWDQAGTKLGLRSLSQANPTEGQPEARSPLNWQMIEKLLKFAATPKSVLELMDLFGWKNRSKFRKKYITPLLSSGVLQMTLPAKPSSPAQQYFLSGKGKKFVEHLEEKRSGE